jgi:hypothetical protein
LKDVIAAGKIGKVHTVYGTAEGWANGGLGSANPRFNGFDVTVSVGRCCERGSRRGPS